jgi:tetratricopeptide (TPR) repeat protein
MLKKQLSFHFLAFSFLLLSSINLFSQSLSAENIYEKVKDAVVVIYAYDYNDEIAKQGSGVVLNDKGYVITNYHVLSGCERLEIMHGNEIIPYIDIIGIDVEKDILILKIDTKKFPSVKVGDVKSLKAGQRVYAVGSPMGFENTISEGIISGLRSYDELEKNYIQITASISSGSSGGAVLNDNGELIGISTLTIKDGQNLNFAIPIDEVLNIEIDSYAKENAFKDFDLFYKGYNAEKEGRHNDAIKYYSQFINNYPNEDISYYNRGLSKYNLSDLRGAIQDFSKAIEINPYFFEAYYNRGVAKYNLGISYYQKDNYSEIENGRKIVKSAKQDLDKAIEIDNKKAIAYYYLANVKYLLGDLEGACQDWSKAGELGYDKAYEAIREICN